MSPSFADQIWIEIIKGFFLVLGVGLASGIASRAVEKYKSQQAIDVDLRKRQYEALGSLLKALAKVETAFNNWHADAKAGRELEAEAAREVLKAAHDEAEAAVDMASYLLGDTIGNQAISLLDFFTDSEDVPLKILDETHYERLTELRQPLIALLPSLPRP